MTGTTTWARRTETGTKKVPGSVRGARLGKRRKRRARRGTARTWNPASPTTLLLATPPPLSPLTPVSSPRRFVSSFVSRRASRTRPRRVRVATVWISCARRTAATASSRGSASSADWITTIEVCARKSPRLAAPTRSPRARRARSSSSSRTRSSPIPRSGPGSARTRCRATRFARRREPWARRPRRRPISVGARSRSSFAVYDRTSRPSRGCRGGHASAISRRRRRFYFIATTSVARARRGSRRDDLWTRSWTTPSSPRRNNCNARV